MPQQLWLEKFLKAYDLDANKIGFGFGCGPWGPHFCKSWFKKWLFLGVLAIFFSELLDIPIKVIDIN